MSNQAGTQKFRIRQITANLPEGLFAGFVPIHTRTGAMYGMIKLDLAQS